MPFSHGISKKIIRIAAAAIGFFIFYAFLFKIQKERVGAFGCFDDCFYYTAAYFMTRGRELFSEIFYNHQMLPAYISFAVQSIFHPQTIFQLLLYHRSALFLFSAGFGLGLIMRFGLAGAGFVITYELTKYYLFGERFLAESFIVYPLVYVFGLFWQKLQKKNLTVFEVMISGILTWFVIFMREPYIPLALLLYIGILWKEKRSTIRLSLGLFFVLTAVILTTIPLDDYFFDVFIVNAKTLGNILTIAQLIKIFFYPFFIFVEGSWNLFRVFLVGVSAVFIAGSALWMIQRKRVGGVIWIWILLGLANVRLVPPGTLYYEGFHMLQWFGLTIASTFFILTSLRSYTKLANILLVGLCALVGYVVLAPDSYVWDRVDRQAEFVTNYAPYVSHGFVIKTIATAGDTLFAERTNDLLYVESGLLPSYPYSWYFFIMPEFNKFSDARLAMFQNNPPVFYFCDCTRQNHPLGFIPKETETDYISIDFAGKPSGLYMLREKAQTVPSEKWELLKNYQYTKI